MTSDPPGNGHRKNHCQGMHTVCVVPQAMQRPDADAKTTQKAALLTEQKKACVVKPKKQRARTPVFPLRLYDMLTNAERDGYCHLISWMPDGRSFRIHCDAEYDGIMDRQTEERIVALLTKFFKQTRFKSFLRQLQVYGFERIYKGPQKGVCRHAMFQRGHKDWLYKKNIISFQSRSMRESVLYRKPQTTISTTLINSSTAEALESNGDTKSTTSTSTSTSTNTDTSTSTNTNTPNQNVENKNADNESSTTNTKTTDDEGREDCIIDAKARIANISHKKAAMANILALAQGVDARVIPSALESLAGTERKATLPEPTTEQTSPVPVEAFAATNETAQALWMLSSPLDLWKRVNVAETQARKLQFQLQCCTTKLKHFYDEEHRKHQDDEFRHASTIMKALENMPGLGFQRRQVFATWKEEALDSRKKINALLKVIHIQRLRSEAFEESYKESWQYKQQQQHQHNSDQGYRPTGYDQDNYQYLQQLRAKYIQHPHSQQQHQQQEHEHEQEQCQQQFCQQQRQQKEHQEQTQQQGQQQRQQSPTTRNGENNSSEPPTTNTASAISKAAIAASDEKAQSSPQSPQKKKQKTIREQPMAPDEKRVAKRSRTKQKQPIAQEPPTTTPYEKCTETPTRTSVTPTTVTTTAITPTQDIVLKSDNSKGAPGEKKTPATRTTSIVSVLSDDLKGGCEEDLDDCDIVIGDDIETTLYKFQKYSEDASLEKANVVSPDSTNTSPKDATSPGSHPMPPVTIDESSTEETVIGDILLKLARESSRLEITTGSKVDKDPKETLQSVYFEAKQAEESSTQCFPTTEASKSPQPGINTREFLRDSYLKALTNAEGFTAKVMAGVEEESDNEDDYLVF